MTTSAPDAPRPNVAALLRDPVFASFFIGKVLSSCGIWIQNIAAAVLMFDLTGSAFMVGLVSMVQFAGPLLLSLWAGGLSDRVDRRRMLMIGRIISGSAVGGLAMILPFVGEGRGASVLLVAVAVMGMGLALSNPAMQALVPSLVADQDLEAALALNSAGGSVARTLGPALGASLLLAGGPPLAFAAAAVGHGMFALALWLLVRPRTPYRRPAQRPDLFGGFRYLWEDRRSGLLMIGVGFLGFGADPVVTLTPSLAAQFGAGSEIVAVFATAFGVGGVVCTFLFGQVRRRLSLRNATVLGTWIVGVGFLVTATSVHVVMAAVGLFLAGGGLMLGMIGMNTGIQHRVPEELRGRVMALWGVAWLGSRPFAASVNGSVADLVSVRAALLTTMCVVLIAGLLARVGQREAIS